MARKKSVKPLFAVKGEFTDSLDAFVDAVVVFRQAVSSALDLKRVSEDVAPLLREKLAALDAAMLTRDED